jgi:septal ring-binding cell division protein DamX
MAYGGKRGAGERVLESRHVIGLFLLMLVFSGIFFALGYVMGRNQYDSQVRAASNTTRASEPVLTTKPEPRKSVEAKPDENHVDPATSNRTDWEFYGNTKPAKTEPRLEPVPPSTLATPASKPVSTKEKVGPLAPPVKNSTNALSASLIPSGAIVLQVAALTQQDDALAIASNLQKKRYAAFVQIPQKDKFYRVQVGPFKDQKTAEAAKSGLEGEGFKAFYVKH